MLSNGPKKRCPDCQLAAKRDRLTKQLDVKRRADEETAARMVKIEASAPLGDSTCERCGKPFIKRDGTAGRFCSRACYETPAPRPPDPAAVVEARDAAVLRYLERHDGVASQKELLAAIPTDDPATTLEAKADALKKSLARLRFKQRIGRTGDTWSLVGAGMTEAHG